MTMNWLAVYKSERASLAMRQAVLSKDEVVACESALTLLQHLEARQQAQEEACEQALEEARARGFEQGRAEALSLVQDQLLAQWSSLAAQSATDEARLREAVLALSVRIVRRIAGAMASEDLLLAMATQAVREEGLREGTMPLVLHVHPDWVAGLRDRMDAASMTGIDVRPDASCGLLDLVIETSTGQVLAGLDDQLHNIDKNLKAALT